MDKQSKGVSPTAKASFLKRLVKLPSRIWYGVRIGFWVISNPEPMAENMFKMLNDLLCLLMKVATEDRHYMTEIMITIDADVPQPLVHIWAGAGASADPHERIKELLKENEALKRELRAA